MDDEEPAEPSFRIRRAAQLDGDMLFTIWWWRSVEATHTFLGERDLHRLAPGVRDLNLETLDTLVLCRGDNKPIGFLTLTGAHVEALFITPGWIGKRGGLTCGVIF